MNVTIVSDKLKEQEVQELQDATESLLFKNYNIQQIQRHLGKHYSVTANIVAAVQGNIVLGCLPN